MSKATKVRVKVVAYTPYNFRMFNLPEGGWIGIDKNGNIYGGSGWCVEGWYYAYRLYKDRPPQAFGWVELTGRLVDGLETCQEEEIC